MPSVNLRLSDEQHRALTAAAARAGRSLQRQIVYMLFAGDTSAHTPRRASSGEAGRSASSSPPTAPERPFRGPDPKPSERKAK